MHSFSVTKSIAHIRLRENNIHKKSSGTNVIHSYDSTVEIRAFSGANFKFVSKIDFVIRIRVNRQNNFSLPVLMGRQKLMQRCIFRSL